MKSRRARLVVQHLEGIAGTVLDEYPEVFREFILGRNGVYALYKGDRLYYVGLARNLRLRLRGHTRDRHAGKWDRFSIYLTEGDEHLKELEALVLRIAEPRGNRVTGKFMDSEDLRRKFREKPKIVLGKYASKRFYIRMDYKGKWFIAHVRKGGLISFAFASESTDWQRLKDKLYLSPSAAASAATGRPTSGWWAWKFKTADGKWVRLSKIRAGCRPARFSP